MTENYQKRLIELATEIHEMQLKESDIQLSSGKTIGVSSDTIRLNSKINFLIGYIMALSEGEKND